MAEKRFDIIFRGQSLEGQDPILVRSQVARLCNVTIAQVEQLFSGRPVIIKRSVDPDTAGRFILAFRRAGALAELVPSVVGATDRENAPTTVHLTALPPNTGSLADCAPPIAIATIPDISGLTIATPGVQLDRSPAPKMPVIDVSNLHLVPGQNWTLKDCEAQFPPPSLPSIPDFSLSASGTILDETPAPPPALIDISALGLVTAKNWSLADCQSTTLPIPTFDLSNFTLANPLAEDQ